MSSNNVISLNSANNNNNGMGDIGVTGGQARSMQRKTEKVVAAMGKRLYAATWELRRSEPKVGLFVVYEIHGDGSETAVTEPCHLVDLHLVLDGIRIGAEMMRG